MRRSVTEATGLQMACRGIASRVPGEQICFGARAREVNTFTRRVFFRTVQFIGNRWEDTPCGPTSMESPIPGMHSLPT
jgi:hypothetical protein